MIEKKRPTCTIVKVRHNFQVDVVVRASFYIYNYAFSSFHMLMYIKETFKKPLLRQN